MSTIRCLIVRHAHAGKRGSAEDERRGLSERGLAQASRIAAELRVDSIAAIVSSPYLRCVETVEPLATALGLTVGTSDALAEGAGAQAALGMVEEADEPVVLCTHGDVIGELISTLAGRGIPLDDDRLAKGSTWVLTVVDGAVTSATYRPPPD